MKKFFSIAVLFLVFLVMLSTCGCKANLDKTKIATLLASYIIDIASGQEFDLGRIDAFAAEWAVQFVIDNKDAIPDKFEKEVIDFATAVIPLVFEEYGVKTQLGKITILGPQAGGEEFEDSVTNFILKNFNEFHDSYKE